MKVWFVQTTRLYKAIRLSCELTKPCKAVWFSYKVTQLCNISDDKNVSAKPLQPCVGKFSCALKFKNVALSMIKYKENWLQWPG